MTYQMKIEEEREAVREEERQNAILTLIKTLKDLSIEKSKVIEQLIKQYSMSELEAQAAVQANW